MSRMSVLSQEMAPKGLKMASMADTRSVTLCRVCPSPPPQPPHPTALRISLLKGSSSSRSSSASSSTQGIATPLPSPSSLKLTLTKRISTLRPPPSSWDRSTGRSRAQALHILVCQERDTQERLRGPIEREVARTPKRTIPRVAISTPFSRSPGTWEIVTGYME